MLGYRWPGDDSGWSLSQMLRMDPRAAPIPIVLCTGAAQEVENLAAHLAAMDIQVVLKPFDIATLAGAIRSALAGEQKREA